MDFIWSTWAVIQEYFKPAVEIGFLSLFIYLVLTYLRGTRGAPVLAGVIVTLMLFTVASDYFKLDVISWLLNSLWAFLAIALVVIFQPEFRRAFAHLGSNPLFRGGRLHETIQEVAIAAEALSVKRCGALMVIEQLIGMRYLAEIAVPVNGRVSHQLLQTIFHTNTPLHDGGVLIKDDTLVAAHCVFPLSTNMDFVKDMGTRHRAAVGVTEETDAVAVVVSEETGQISIAFRGSLKRGIQAVDIPNYLNALLGVTPGMLEILDEFPDADAPRKEF